MNAPYESATHFKKDSVARGTEAGTAQRIYTVAASLDGLKSACIECLSNAIFAKS
ncbi:MAG: hypothetical protein JWQ49_4473 [Edaphobacter sp.]|nr:hypothetical protein [Edaphobacter sp.]